MTYVFKGDLGNVIEEFLLSALPFEERFDEWKGYFIICLAEEREIVAIGSCCREAVSRLTSRQA